MISKQRGIIDPWTLGFLLSLIGLTTTQAWDRNSETDVISNSTLNAVEKMADNKNQNMPNKYFNNI